MRMWEGILASVRTTGNTTITLTRQTFGSMSNRSLWDKACFGVSLTEYNGSAVSIFITGFLGNGAVVVPVAGLSGLATTVSRILPVLTGQGNINGSIVSGLSEITTYGGVLTPRQVIFGNSAIVGKTYGAIVYATLMEE